MPSKAERDERITTYYWYEIRNFIWNATHIIPHPHAAAPGSKKDPLYGLFAAASVFLRPPKLADEEEGGKQEHAGAVAPLPRRPSAEDGMTTRDEGNVPSGPQRIMASNLPMPAPHCSEG